ncbi:hypothetical protein [Bacillus coahuilensis]|uniref:hypothetical protein n=1 Tax=Bacillus coahuilensis TaxID=408580 RepID=UPI000750B8B6|nr:hypothetical protein [Bacillus coahuilensis]
MKKTYWMSLIVILLLLGACGAEEDSMFSRNDQEGTQFVDNDVVGNNEEDWPTARTQTNQNPNFIDLSENQPTLGTDVDKARETIAELTPYEADEVWINGGQMWVTVHTNKNLTSVTRDNEEAELHDTLTRALPRYKIHVELKEK